MNKQTIYEKVNGIILNHLRQGVIPWRKTWDDRGMPVNRLTKKPYRGINRILLNLLPYASNEFLSFNQIKQLGGKVHRGEQGHIIVFWKWIEPLKNEEVNIEEDLTPYPIIQHHYVWNIEQCDGVEPYSELSDVPFIPIIKADEFVEAISDKPVIIHEGSEAFYSPRHDLISLPECSSFECPDFYYSVLFHELIHSTGHESRLKRKGITDTIVFGSKDYSFEELIAEIGACYLLLHCNLIIDDFSNNAAYISGWLKKLERDSHVFIKASVQAQKALDYLSGIKEQGG